MLYNIYRYCDQRPGTRLFNINKVHCYNNFKSVFDNETEFVFDNCTSNLIDEPAHHVHLGNCGSFQYALDLALKHNDDDFVYFIEDDYLHKSGAQKILLEGLNAFDGFITMYDPPDKYDVRKINPLVAIDGSNAGENTVLYLTKSTHWKITNSTTMTFAGKVSNIRKVSSIMRAHSNHPGAPTDFQMWLDIKKVFGLNVYSCVPGYSTHCEIGYESPLIDWNKVYAGLE